MPYYLRGNLWGYICRECPRPLWGVIVRAYAAEGERLIERAVADPKQTATTIDEREVQARSKRLLAEAKVGEDGSFELDFGGFGSDPWGNYKAGASAKTVINREDFGLTWNAALETGGVLVGKDVTISLDLQGALQQD